MKIIADENIPLLQHYFGDFGELVLMPGRMIVHQDLVDADILLVRSVTHVNKALLENTPVKFVGSATTGADHLDIEWLDQAGIKWATALGSNSEAVSEYVICVVAALQKMEFLMQRNIRAGVIGVGNIGKRVVEMLKLLDFDVVQCDPVRAQNEPGFQSTQLRDFADLDFISMHTPLVTQGLYPTYHMIDKEFILRQKKEAILLNAGRGSVINFADLKRHGEYLNWCLDVWENEPKIDMDILGASVLATPHIAGYSIQGKCLGTKMIYEAACRMQVVPDYQKNEIIFPSNTISFAHARVDWRDVVLKIYDPFKTSQHMKDALLSHHEMFDNLRKHFVERHEFAYVKVKDAHLMEDDRDLLKDLGISVTVPLMTMRG